LTLRPDGWYKLPVFPVSPQEASAMSDTRASQLPLDAAYAILVYPFEHAISDNERRERLESLTACWRPWLARMTEAGRAAALDDTYFFLPYIRELLFPETTRVPGGDVPQQLAHADWALKESLPEFASHVAETAVLRLSYDTTRLAALRPLELVLDAGATLPAFAAPFEIDWVDVALFPQNMGFLALKVRLAESQPTVERWIDFLSELRLIHPPKLTWHLAKWHVAGGQLDASSRDMVDFFLQGLTRDQHIRPALGDFLPYLRRVPDRARYTASPNGQVYGGTFHQFIYGCLGSTAVPLGEQACTDPAPHLFPSAMQRALYELATCTSTEDPSFVPHRTFLEALWRDNLIALWDNWQALALRDNVIFLGTGPGDFVRETLPHIAESDYFQLYLLVLFQKTRLSVIFGDLVRKEEDLTANLREVRLLWDRFVTFQNLFWYREVTRKQQGDALYRRFQQGLEVRPIYEDAVEQSRELKAYYEGKAQRRTASLLFFLTIIGLSLSTAVTAVANRLLQGNHWVWWGVGLVALPVIVYLLWRVWDAIRGE
jgi:hypothetical protein